MYSPVDVKFTFSSSTYLSNEPISEAIEKSSKILKLVISS